MLPSASPYKITRGFLHTPIRRIHNHDGPATDCAGITADVLPAAGSGSPEYFTENCVAVADGIPRGRAKSSFPGRRTTPPHREGP